jgi:hypothetical protein
VAWIATGMTRARATCTLGAGKPFPCTKVTYSTTSSTVTVLMAPRVRGSGIVSYEIVRDGQPVWTMKTIGYGTAKTVEWGVGPPSPALVDERDTSDLMIGMREGSVYAVEDVYEAGDPVDSVPPRVELYTVKVIGLIGRELVRRKLKRRIPPMTACYEKLVARGGLTREKVTVAFTIAPTGRLVDLVAEGPTSLKRCVKESLDGLEFPRSDGGGVNQVECTLAFDPGVPRPTKPVKRKLIKKGHPMRGGPDLRGVTISRPP